MYTLSYQMDKAGATKLLQFFKAFHASKRYPENDPSKWSDNLEDLPLGHSSSAEGTTHALRMVNMTTEESVWIELRNVLPSHPQASTEFYVAFTAVTEKTAHELSNGLLVPALPLIHKIPVKAPTLH